ncbi:MAG: alpha/beta hydrolase [Deltaproteobacteria bacterium]|nr:alpha/beta hydrolase [Deltaproteobacteria bacterium]
MSATLYLVLAALGFGAALSTNVQARRLGPLVAPYFLFAWLVGELAPHAITAHALLSAGFIAGGALESGRGVAALALTLASVVLLLRAHLRGANGGAEAASALGEIGVRAKGEVPALFGFPRAFSFAQPGVEKLTDIAYGPVLPGDKGKRNLLDVIRPRGAKPGERRPVLLQVHGGGWIIGDKREQAQPLMTHMAAEHGWISVAVNYRLSPQATFPDHIVDVKRAIAWIRAHIAEYGGDPSFVCVTGGSAGGHLTALTALSANDPRFQPGFEHVDTRMVAAVPFYGVFDFLDRKNLRGSQSMIPMLAKTVFKKSPEQDPELWNAMSPITRITEDAPPFLVIQGTHDTLVFVEEAREFVRALKEKSRAPVAYLEMLGAQHAFDVFHSPRSRHAVLAVAAFLEKVRAERQR